MTHPWISSGSKRTVWWNYVPSTNIMQYPGDMRDAIHEGVMKAEEMRRMNGKIPSPIDLRKAIKPWFDMKYDYARHHVNPVCGEKVKHPAWKISKCNNCDRDYGRDRLASLAITLRGIDLCGDPFPVSALASWQSMKNEYLYIRD